MDHLDLSAVHLDVGGHEPDSGQYCINELVSVLAGEAFSDQPQCVSPVLRAFCMRWNDDLDDATRQRLVPYAPRLVGTAGDGADERRAWLVTDWLARTYAPAWLRLAPALVAHADRLAAAPEITDADAARRVGEVLDDAATAAHAAGSAAWAAAGDAAGAAARDAAWAAARAAAGSAAWDAAGAAAGSAAWDAAGAAARDAAWDAAGAAARARLQPTVTDLQERAFGLLDKLCAPALERTTTSP